MAFASRYKPAPSPVHTCRTPSLARQSEFPNTDIRQIVARFKTTGVLPISSRVPQYGDFSRIGDYQSLLNKVRDVQDYFDSLPSDVRARFDNSATVMLDFLADPANTAEAVEMGIKSPLEETPAENTHNEKAAE